MFNPAGISALRGTFFRAELLCDAARVLLHNMVRRGPALSAVRSTKKRSRAALLIPLAFIALDCGLRLWSAESIPGGLLSVAGAIIWFVLEIRGYGVRSWIDEEIKPRKGEGKGGLL